MSIGGFKDMEGTEELLEKLKTWINDRWEFGDELGYRISLIAEKAGYGAQSDAG